MIEVNEKKLEKFIIRAYSNAHEFFKCPIRGWGACKCQRGLNCSENYNEEDLKELIENVIKELKGEENE